jgi:pimeloyl-ACP methyl ester carboxylesterase
MSDTAALAPLPLPDGIRARMVSGVNGLDMHILEAGDDAPERPCLLLLHGFPEIAYSWRKVMPALAAAGYYVVAPDQRGYGRTTGWVNAYDTDLVPFRMLNVVRDVLALVNALGRASVEAVIGHDFGSPVAAWCALARPDVFAKVALMSAPFGGPPSWGAKPAGDIHADMAALDRPRKHYQWYYATRPANDDMCACPQGIADFLRAYYHHKSADWAANVPYPLAGWTAEELAKMPTYYIMDLNQNMAETVAQHMPSAACAWLPDDELAVYAGEYARNGFQGGLQFYRCATSPEHSAELRLFAGRGIDVPSLFIAGKSDWGTYQKPGDFARMQQSVCTDMRGCHLVEGAGHWVQQEQAAAVTTLLLDFLDK